MNTTLRLTWPLLPSLILWTVFILPVMVMATAGIGMENAAGFSPIFGVATAGIVLSLLGSYRAALYVLPVSRRKIANWLWLLTFAYPLLLVLMGLAGAGIISGRYLDNQMTWTLDTRLIFVLPMLATAVVLPCTLALERFQSNKLVCFFVLLFLWTVVTMGSWHVFWQDFNLRWSTIPLFYSLIVALSTLAIFLAFLLRVRLVDGLYSRVLRDPELGASVTSGERAFEHAWAAAISAGARQYRTLLVLIVVTLSISTVFEYLRRGRLVPSEVADPFSFLIFLQCWSVYLAMDFLVGRLRHWQALAALPLTGRQRLWLLEFVWLSFTVPLLLTAMAGLFISHAENGQVYVPYLALAVAIGPVTLAQCFWRPRAWLLLVALVLLLALLLVVILLLLPVALSYLLLLGFWVLGHFWLRYSLARQGKPHPDSLRIWGSRAA